MSTTHEYNYDVIVVGGGSSGLMAAINAAEQGVRVLVIDKNPKLGRKLLLSGGGRCNVTNRTSREELIKHIPGNGKFLYSALNQFDQEDIITFFEGRGIALKEEDHGRMFPVTDSARTILGSLVDVMNKLGVTVRLKDPIDSVLYEEGRVIGVLTRAGETITAPSVVLAAGGRAYPRTGAEGDAYAWSRSAGHTIERLYPTEAPLLSRDDFIVSKALRGVSLRDVAVTLWDTQLKGSPAENAHTFLNSKIVPLTIHQMDMIFTHFGYSGPAILRCSGHVNQYLHRTGFKTAYLSINFVPNETRDAMKAVAEEMREKQLMTVLKQWMPEAMATQLLVSAELEPTTPYKQLVHAEVERLFDFIQAFPITAYESQPIEKGFVTGGGVSTKEVNPSTMESRLMTGLYFCGELLDINGYTGGYNITAAFVTGTIAGRNAAWSSFAG
ncbi:NAD(P)/FAD-dependent oxidoreductase [Fundicoccus sp. Sow4_F4]|uniref:NAD(P)/FAD-dependent oxidoreductase n=1 Tax=Fundicoccus sp. Sow4_F4 TaxID=3438783 RepID=UPI003F8E3339